jgi:hypothetical protein
MRLGQTIRSIAESVAIPFIIVAGAAIQLGVGLLFPFRELWNAVGDRRYGYAALALVRCLGLIGFLTLVVLHFVFHVRL